MKRLLLAPSFKALVLLTLISKNLQQSVSERPWDPYRCSCHKSHSCSLCWDHATCTTSKGWAEMVKDFIFAWWKFFVWHGIIVFTDWFIISRNMPGKYWSCSTLSMCTYLAIPAKWQILGVVWYVILIIIRLLITGILIIRLLSLLSSASLFALNIVPGSCPLFTQDFH